VPVRLPGKAMIAVAAAVRDDEGAAAAAHFSALKTRSHIRVVEASTVPRTHVTAWIVAKVGAGGTEPIGQRIVEVPGDLEQFELRDGRARFVAYVPPGSIGRGEALVTTGGAGKTLPCGLRRGADLRGEGLVPGIAGRSPSDAVRQLFDFQSGARAGVDEEPMKPVVAELSEEDMVSLAAYLTSRPP